jgi:predicted amidohydrolase
MTVGTRTEPGERRHIRVAAWQAPLLESGSLAALPLIREQVEQCESEGVQVLCCPEAILGGLADYAADPRTLAIARERLDTVLEPIASDRVSTIVGFSELAPNGRLFNAAAVFQRGRVAGIYRKHHPALHRSVYERGEGHPIFDVDGFKFGIVICNDSNFIEPARSIAAQEVAALFVPTNNALPPGRGGAEIVALARRADIARAMESRVWVIRADVAGRTGTLVSCGASGIVDPNGVVVRATVESGRRLVAEIDVGWQPASPRRAH